MDRCAATISRGAGGGGRQTAHAPWAVEDIPDQTGRVAVITGANTGVGFATAAELADHGADVVLAVRNAENGQRAAAAIRQRTPDAAVWVQVLDLASLESIDCAAAELGSAFDRIDLLINNAGVLGGPRSTTTDGFEMDLGTNHLGHFALTGLLMGHLLATPESRVVTLSSAAHRLSADIDFDDLQSQRKYNANGAYARSKLANLLFTYELQRRLAAGNTSMSALAAHPGGTRSGLSRHSSLPARLFNGMLQDPAMGALPTLRAATDPMAVGGQYYGPRGLFEAFGRPKVVQSSPRSHDRALQRELWTVSEELTGVTYPPLPAKVSKGEQSPLHVTGVARVTSRRSSSTPQEHP
jgi:NAD(P)-dependent dehydrogenase (short-subunit alcohol dehydrogenase family)